MKLRGVVLILVLIFLAQTVFAFKFDVEITPEVRAIKTNESAEFNLKLSHDSVDNESFSIYSPDINWNILLSKYPYFAQGEHELKLTIIPVNVNPGVYRIPIYIKSNSNNDVLKRQVSIELTAEKSLVYERLPAIRAKLDFPGEVDPRVPVKLSLFLENRNNRELENILIKVRSELINEDYKTSLKGNEKKQVDFTIKLPEKTRPVKDFLKVSILIIEPEKNYRYDVETRPYSIIKYGKVVIDKKIDKGLFTKSEIIKFTNTANYPQRETYEKKLGFIEKLFTSLNPEPVNGLWSFELGVNEEKTIRIYTSYVPLVILLIFSILVIIAYYFIRSPVVLIKKTQVLKSTEGGISKLKILLYVKNRSSRNVKNVRIIDVIPRLADFIEKKYEGTVNPITVKRLENGTLLKWQINLLEPGEERIIYYNVRNKLSVLEGLTLPVAVAKFNVEGKVERATKSNVIDVEF